MPETNIGSSTIGDMKTNQSDYSVDSADTDGVYDQKETKYYLSDWSKHYGYYKKIPELKAAIDAKAVWVVGKGFTSNELTEISLSLLKGFGKDSFNTIIENMLRTRQIAGDAFAEIIRDSEGQLVNLKPLNPGTMCIVANDKGVIIRYEQNSRVKDGKPKIFQPEDIFHLARNRVADEIHGQSLVPEVEDIILMRNEAMADYKKLLHRNVFPVRIFHLDTDNTTEIAAFKAKQDQAQYQGENIYIPKGAVETELSAVPTNATLNPLPWINQLNQYFFQATGVPQIIVGGAQEITEASAKIAYLAWEQTVEEDQRELEEQILSQLNLEVNFEFPASLQNEMLNDGRKEESMQAATPEDTNVQGMALNPADSGVKR